jgi:acyl-CoA synthetase (AMP-forming)/AMP-acid ligase II
MPLPSKSFEMAPFLFDPLSVKPTSVNIIPACSDPSVVPPDGASKANKTLWWLHGHPHSKQYANPNLVSLAALVRHDGLIYRGQPGFLYPVGPESSYKAMTWDEFDKITEDFAALYANNLCPELEDANMTQRQPTVALLGGGNSVEYFCTQIGLMKLGIRVLLLAESNSTNALHHLLDSCDVSVVITDVKNAKVEMQQVRKIKMVESLPRGSTVSSSEVDSVRFQDFGNVWERHTFIIHSSGSTSLPKPIIHTNRSMMLIARMYRLFQDFEVKNWFLLFPL